MTSRPETPTQTTGAHRAHRDGRGRPAPRTVPQRPASRYEPHLDGLFTYCLSVLCDHDDAVAALGEALALAERRGSRGPEGESDRKAWLYALARWSCLRALAEAKRRRQGAHASGRPAPEAREKARKAHSVALPSQSSQGQGAPSQSQGAASQGQGAPSDETQARRRRELALLAWPEAAGTTPEQREALELAVRHQLSPKEVAAALGTDPGLTRELLASAACEVERTRAALAVVETGTCPSVARLTGDNQLLLSSALRRELVRHVDDCPRCRRTAERAAPGAWPGTTVTPAALPLVTAPRTALHAAMVHGGRPQRGVVPRFDGRGFPMDPKDRAARRDRLRARAVTTTVVATVVAAPVLALWAAYRGAPTTGEGQDGRSISASEAGEPGGLDGNGTDGAYENAGNASTTPDSRFTAGSRSPDVSVEVVTPGGPTRSGPGRLTVEAQPSGSATLITLTASGSSPVHWSARTGADWLYLTSMSGTLRPGESFTIRVYIDHDREPAGHWSARIGIDPSGAVISIEGHGSTGPSQPGSPSYPAPDPSNTGNPGPGPSDPSPTPSDPTPTDPAPTPSDPSPTPSDPSPSPSAPTDSAPPPSDSGTASPTGG
ncbi:sigma-70 family RNA polymerase sigma factor [Streptomyces antnestii]|uniref:Sigma-70 family RNA polymerase sigma factor n=1 Tax=Streptomyces antnestii TaxID=2494256 RepID=A0A437P3F2_9ACTN|nr:sigma-70 family RNA polymerase sigma factor [Streptomyces sp. San01]RVU16782.1 sigma-70 family RNA polymerase sigma factor [Streptomyces sp. San01]